MLDYRYETFLTVCETLNYTKAADLLSITQPAVSKHIAYLQEELGFPLFDYRNKQLFLTREGEELYRLVMRIKNESEHGVAALRNHHYDFSLFLGCTLTIGNVLIVPQLIAMIQQHPEVRLNFYLENTRSILRSLATERLDCAFVEGDFDHSKFNHIYLKSVDMVAVCAPDHVLAETGTLTLKDVKGKTLILREPGSGIRDTIMEMLMNHHLQVDDLDTMVISNYSIMKTMVEVGLGFAFFYEPMVREELAAGSLIRLGAEWELPTQPLYFVYTRKSKATQFVLDHFEIFNQSATPDRSGSTV